MRNYGWIERFLHPARGFAVFWWTLALVYGIVPAYIYYYVAPNDYFLQLSILTGLTLFGLLVGARISLFDRRFSANTRRIGIDLNVFQTIIWGGFILFIAITLVTAPSIPILSALKGASANDLSQERGEFLKNRAGAEVILLYASTILVNTFLPYSTVLLYATKSRLRFLCTGIFFLFCISFLQKALFLNLALPLLVFFAIDRKLPTRQAMLWAVSLIGLLIIGTYLSSGDGGVDSKYSGGTIADYLSSTYVPDNPLDHLIWRSFAVPVFTASDMLLVHAEYFGGYLLNGATSTLLSALFDLERVNIERYVFEYQFGGWNEIANANAVFIVDAYVNFGYLGVVSFALIVGQIFRWFRLSSDVAFRSLWPLFAFVLFSASLIGMLFSNGFIYMIFHALMIKIKSGSDKGLLFIDKRNEIRFPKFG